MSYTTSASPCGGKGKDTFANKKKMVKKTQKHAFSACFCLKEGLKGAFLARARQGKGSVSRPQGVGMIVSRQRYEKNGHCELKYVKTKILSLFFCLSSHRVSAVIAKRRPDASHGVRGKRA